MDHARVAAENNAESLWFASYWSIGTDWAILTQRGSSIFKEERK